MKFRSARQHPTLVRILVTLLWALLLSVCVSSGGAADAATYVAGELLALDATNAYDTSALLPDPLVCGDHLIVIEKPGGKSALRESIETVPALGFFLAS